MNNKKNKGYFLAKIKQALAKKHLLLLLPLCFGLVGCNKEESDRDANKQVELLRPYHALAVNLEDEELFVAFNNFVNANEEPTEVLINGALCYSSDPNIAITDSCKLSYNKTTNSVNAKFSAISQGLIQGNNTVTVKNTDRNTQESVEFYYDNQKPTLVVEQIKLSDSNAITGPNDELVSGAIVDITLTIKDPSDIKSVEFKANNKTYPGLISEKEAYELAGSNIEDKRQAMKDWEASHQAYLADLKAKRFVVEGVEWPTPDGEGSKFTYEIVDVHGQKSEGTFVVSGSTLVRSQAIQLNNTFFQHIAPVLNRLLDESLKEFYVRKAKILDPYRRKVEPTPLDPNDPNSDEIYVLKPDPPTGSSPPYMGDIEVAEKQLLQFCGAFNWGSTCSGFFHIDKIKVATPRVTVRGQDSDAFELKLGLHFASASIPFTIFTSAGDRFDSTFYLENFELYSRINLTPPEEDDLLDYTRTPLGLYIIPNILGKQQVYLKDSKCSGRRCNIFTGFLEPVYNLGIGKEGKNAAKSILSGLEGMLTVVEDKLAEKIGDTTKRPIPLSNTTPYLLKRPQKIERIVNRRANIFDKTPRNAHFGFDSAVAAQRLDNNGFVINPSLGVELKSKGSYNYVKNANFPSYEPGVNGSLIDFAYAISEDSVNQILLNEYQKAGENTARVITVSAPNEPNRLFFGGESVVCIKVDAKTAPKVEFYGYYSQKLSVDGTFTDKIAEDAAKEKAENWKQQCISEGKYTMAECNTLTDSYQYESKTLFDTSKESVPSSIKLVMDNVLLSAKAGACQGTPMELNEPWPLAESVEVDITNRVTVTMKDSKPFIEPYNRKDDGFVLVHAKEEKDGANAAEFASIIAVHVNNALSKFSDSQHSLGMVNGAFSFNWSGQHLDDISVNDIPLLRDLLAIPIEIDSLTFTIGDIFLSQLNNNWRVHYGVNFLSFGIEPSGDYFRFAGEINTKTSENGECEANNYFLYSCIKK